MKTRNLRKTAKQLSIESKIRMLFADFVKEETNFLEEPDENQKKIHKILLKEKSIEWGISKQVLENSIKGGNTFYDDISNLRKRMISHTVRRIKYGDELISFFDSSGLLKREIIYVTQSSEFAATKRGARTSMNERSSFSKAIENINVLLKFINDKTPYSNEKLITALFDEFLDKEKDLSLFYYKNDTDKEIKMRDKSEVERIIESRGFTFRYEGTMKLYGVKLEPWISLSVWYERELLQNGNLNLNLNNQKEYFLICLSNKYNDDNLDEIKAEAFLN